MQASPEMWQSFYGMESAVPCRMATLLVSWVGVSLLFCLALLRAASRPQPTLQEALSMESPAPAPEHVHADEAMLTSNPRPSLRAA